MDLTNSTVVKTPDVETETPTPTRIQPAKATPLTNGVLKRHAPLHIHHHHHHPVVVTYKECLKNHAATLGGHAVDGCGEFMPSPTSNPADPTSLKCAACGCHRNFHRREPDNEPLLLSSHTPNAAAPALEYRPHHRHHPPPPDSSPNNSPSPPPISSSYYPSAPHMLLALSHPPPDGITAPIPTIHFNPNSAPLLNSNSRKRFRSKFTQNQKEKMLDLAERVGWKMVKRDDDMIREICDEIGVDKGVFKVWMHNNKNTFGKKDHLSNISAVISTPPAATTNIGGISYSAIGAAAEEQCHHHQHQENDDRKENVHENILDTNGSPSS